MAQTLLQEPGTLPSTSATTKVAAGVNNLMFVVSSSNATQPQFRYIAEVIDLGYTGLKFKTYPNEDGSGVFDLGRPLNDRLTQKYYWDTAVGDSIGPNFNWRNFQIYFYEEYGTSISSSITESALQTTSSIIQVWPCQVDPNYGTFNFFDTYRNAVLTDYPFYSGSAFDAGQTSYMKTISYDNDYETFVFNPLSGSMRGANSYYPQAMQVETYDTNGSLLTTSSFSLAGLGEGVGVGPQNFRDAGGQAETQFNGDWYYYRIRFQYPGSPTPYEYRWFKRNTECEDYKTRFTWINKLGVWDYYNTYLYDLKSTSVDRKNYKQIFVNYAGRNPQYDISRRGTTQYTTNYQDNFTITSNWLTQAEADWLYSLFEANEAFVQVGTEFYPINITSADYQWRTNPRGQKVFQYTFNYQYSNSRFSR